MYLFHKFLLIMLHPSERNPSQFGFSNISKWSSWSPLLSHLFLGFPIHQPSGLQKKNNLGQEPIITAARSGWKEMFTLNSS